MRMRGVWVSLAVGWLLLVCAARGQTTRTTSRVADGAAATRTAASAAGSSDATTSPTTAEARQGGGGGGIDLGVSNVRIEMYGWEEADRRFTPGAGLASGDGSMREEMLSGRYQMALAG